MKFKKLFLLIPAFVVFFVLFFLIIKDGFTKVKVFKVTKGTLTNSISASGTIDSDQKASLSFPLGGTVYKVNTKEGDAVKKDQILVSAESSKEYDTYLSYKASYDQAQYNLELFKEQYKDDPDTALIGSEDIYWEKIKYLEEAVNYSKGLMVASLVSVSDKYIKAPFDSIVSQLLYKENEYAGPGITIIKVYNPESNFFKANFDEEDFGFLKEGLLVKASLDGFPNETFEGNVKSLPKTLSKDNGGTNVFEVKIALPENLITKAIIDMKGDATVIVSSKTDTLFFDDSGLIEENGDKLVYKVENGKAQKTKVEVGISGDQGAEALSGLNEGDIVIISDTSKIKNHKKVKYD